MYLEESELKASLYAYRQTGECEALFRNLQLLGSNLATKYARYQDHEDAVILAVIRAFEVQHRYDESKGKAFNYFTTVLLNEFRQFKRRTDMNDRNIVRYRLDMINRLGLE